MAAPRIDAIDKNFLINGSFDYFQRSLSTPTTINVAGYYAPDRWLNTTNNQAFTVRRATDLPVGSLSEHSLEYNTVLAIGAASFTFHYTLDCEL